MRTVFGSHRNCRRSVVDRPHLVAHDLEKLDKHVRQIAVVLDDEKPPPLREPDFRTLARDYALPKLRERKPHVERREDGVQDGNPEELLAQIVNRVVKRGGSIVIPAFAIGRTQTFMYYLRRLEDQQRIPRIPVYVDSPMALRATDLYIKHKEDHDLEFAREEGSDGKGDPLNVHEFHLTPSAEESKAINKVKTPCIIISASGMVSGGRVLHHMVQRLPDAKNAVILAGFQAEGTRGRALQEGAKTLNIFGQAVPVCAEIVEMGQLSAHAGKSELLRWLAALPTPPVQTYLTHGEPAAAQALQGAIQEKFRWKAAVARYLDTVPLGA